MSSTLTVTNLTSTNLTDGGGTTSTFANVVKGAVKTWICLENTSTTAIVELDSFNVSSTTDVSNNDSQIDMTNAMSNANFCELGTHSGTALDRFISFVHTSKTSSRMFATAYDVTSGDVGVNRKNICAVGDLA